MTAYHYPLWRKQYFFHQSVVKDESLLSIYHPYSVLTKVAWFGWKNNWIIRRTSRLPKTNIPFDFSILERIVDGFENYSWVINLGSDYEERRTTLLLRNKLDATDVLFIKIGTNEKARQLVRNEIKILEELTGKGVAPQIKRWGDEQKFTYLVTKAFMAKKVKSFELTETIYAIIQTVAGFKQLVTDESTKLVQAFSHGDFCPWNMLTVDEEIKVIDWETAGYKLLGFDLFTYIFKTGFELTPKTTCADLLAEHQFWINKFFAYFGISNPRPYLMQYALLMQEEYKTDKKLNQHFDTLVNYLNKL